jgi:hypothetical protein
MKQRLDRLEQENNMKQRLDRLEQENTDLHNDLQETKVIIQELVERVGCLEEEPFLKAHFKSKAEELSNVTQ